jgi:hypothetical protein
LDNKNSEFAAELSTYSKKYLNQLSRFGTKQWLDMIGGGEFTPELFFNIHGPIRTAPFAIHIPDIVANLK